MVGAELSRLAHICHTPCVLFTTACTCTNKGAIGVAVLISACTCTNTGAIGVAVLIFKGYVSSVLNNPKAIFSGVSHVDRTQ